MTGDTAEVGREDEAEKCDHQKYLLCEVYGWEILSW